MTFLFSQFSSTCSYQCLWEAAGRTEDRRPWVFYCWKCSIQSGLSISSLCPKVPHPSRLCSSSHTDPWPTHPIISLLPLSHLVPDKRQHLDYDHLIIYSQLPWISVTSLHGPTGCLPFLPTPSAQAENSIPGTPNTLLKPQKHLPKWINQFVFLNSAISFLE